MASQLLQRNWEPDFLGLGRHGERSDTIRMQLTIYQEKDGGSLQRRSAGRQVL